MDNHKRIVMCGCHQGGANAILELVRHGYKFAAFVCLTPAQAVKYQISGYYDYRPMAKDLGIPVYVPETYSLTASADMDYFSQGRFDLLIQGGWQRLFPDVILKTLRIGALGLHGSADQLPKGRGRSPLNWSLIEGRKRFLMHLFIIQPGVDDGDVIGITDFDILDFDDIETLYIKYDLAYRKLLINHLPDVFAGVTRMHPQLGSASYYLKRTPEDGRIDWEEMDVWTIYNFVRGQSRPYPGAFGEIKGKVIRLWRCRPFDTRIRYEGLGYGEIIEKFGNRLLVNCRGGLLLIDEWEYE
jgi:methionyl-tRNA formyltransferase